MPAATETSCSQRAVPGAPVLRYLRAVSSGRQLLTFVATGIVRLVLPDTVFEREKRFVLCPRMPRPRSGSRAGAPAAKEEKAPPAPHSRAEPLRTVASTPASVLSSPRRIYY